MNGRRPFGIRQAMTIAPFVAMVMLAAAAFAQGKEAESAAAPSKPDTAPDPSRLQPGDLPSVPIEELRRRANANEIPAMEELGRRLIQGTGVSKDPQGGAGWLLHAAELGSAQSAFNVGVMYERGFVVERDSSKAVEWYRKAADAGLPAAKHNLALLLRDGKGAPRDMKAATDLLRAAALHGMTASMFSLGDIYEQGDSGTKDPAAALAWFAVAGEFGRQSNRDADAALARAAEQRAQILKRTLTTAELERAQGLAQRQFREIVAALTPARKPAPATTAAADDPASASPSRTPPPADDNAWAWPKTAADQVRAVQQALFDINRLRGKPDGALGPLTRAAIRDFQKSAGMPPTGEPTKDVYFALKLARRDVVSESPLPTPPQVAAADVPAKVEPSKLGPPTPEPPKPQVATPSVEASIDLGQPPSTPPPPSSAEVAATTPKVPAAKVAPSPKIDPPKPAPLQVVTAKPEPVKVETAPPAPKPIDIGSPPSAPLPPTSTEISRSTPADANAWPTKTIDQVKAIQKLLHDLRFYGRAIDGQASTATRAAIRDYQRTAGLKESGEPSRALFESLKEMRKLMAPAVPATAADSH
jgi:peptidoglycan hydrolase-like protein with peptidoglycan-binding domain